MSTFRGVVQEFPDIRIDFFRPVPGLRPPRQCFLSHVHSDHLVGLDSFHSCFIYCSAATREILLRLEKYPQRLNFHRGILEKPPKVTYKHLSKLLKTIPLETPTRIELEPGNDIQVTLFDANHCTGAVMFLIEGDNKAILYTGDIRSEPWFVNNLTRNPFMIEYTSGLKTLDCIYLDTSNTMDIPFPTKADGLKELLRKVSKYPDDTVFHFTAWTFGYEEVWMALSKALKSQIHVDEYKMRLYGSLRGKSYDPKDSTNDAHLSGPFLAHEGPTLTGYKCGNVPQPGCLTADPNVNVRIHSCEKGLHCNKLKEKTVWIRPIVTRTEHGEIAEVGVGGGGGDLSRRPEIVLDSDDTIDEFLGLFAETENLVKMDIKRMLREGLRSHRTALSLDDMGLDPKQGDFSLTRITEALARSVAEKRSARLSDSLTDKVQTEPLPRLITFPYARHSSYTELCHLVRVFNPRDIYPCTVDEENWDEGVSIQNLFGRECSATKFRHDDEMRELHAERQLQFDSQQSHTTATSDASSQILPPSTPTQRVAQTSKRASIRGNSQGQLQHVDAVVTSIKQGQKAIDGAISLVDSTLPQDIINISPGSASQNLRRKAIHDGLEGQGKRARLSYNGPNSSSTSEADPRISASYRREHDMPIVLEISDDDSDEAAPTPESATDSANMPITGSFSAIQTLNGDAFERTNDPYIREFDMYMYNYDRDDNTYIDREDNIVRCNSCGCEVWTIWMTQRGFCTGNCEKSRQDGPNEDPYDEVIDPEAGPQPGFEPSAFANVLLDTYAIQHQDLRNIVGDYLDNHSDAYDTVDENSEYRSEYDYEDSFIDDASTHSSENEADGENSSNDGETDYKQRFNELQRKYEGLVFDHGELVEHFEGTMKELLGDDYSGDGLESLISDEDGALLVDVVVPDPAVAELVLSQAEEQSQESEVSPDRIRDRIKSFEAAAGNNWNNISIVSTGDNHTREEIEL